MSSLAGPPGGDRERDLGKRNDREMAPPMCTLPSLDDACCCCRSSSHRTVAPLIRSAGERRLGGCRDRGRDSSDVSRFNGTSPDRNREAVAESFRREEATPLESTARRRPRSGRVCGLLDGDRRSTIRRDWSNCFKTFEACSGEDSDRAACASPRPPRPATCRCADATACTHPTLSKVLRGWVGAVDVLPRAWNLCFNESSCFSIRSFGEMGKSDPDSCSYSSS
mmetsp:Transcript_73754/g.240208  ORF Transcript_73754/g.240208 Transcript_73754/m.240208 type:complete len:224 (+) Transcript_73754:3173-3844(+)